MQRCGLWEVEDEDEDEESRGEGGTVLDPPKRGAVLGRNRLCHVDWRGAGRGSGLDGGSMVMGPVILSSTCFSTWVAPSVIPLESARDSGRGSCTVGRRSCIGVMLEEVCVRASTAAAATCRSSSRCHLVGPAGLMRSPVGV